MMTIDDGGGRGGLASDDVTNNCQIFGRFLGISSDSLKKILVIFENFLKINNVRRKIFK
jgi:hypothetical protein